MIPPRPALRPLIVASITAGLFACGRGDDAPSPAADNAAPAVSQAGGAHDMGGMHMDPATMRRHAQEMDSTVADMRRHVQAMQQVSPEQWHARMGEHAGRVARMLSLVDRQMREMDMGMGMDDAHMGEMMGMSAEEHRRMMEQIRGLRAEVEELQTASEAEVRRRMPDHLRNLQQFLPLMEGSAEHMRSAH